MRLNLAGIVPPMCGDLEVALAAVLEDHAGALSYWALAHPAEEADFHDPRAFLLTLPRARGC